MTKHSPNRCVHFTGILDDHCEIGVVYDQCRRKGSMLPCVHPQASEVCPLYLEPTVEQIAESERLSKERWERDMKVMPVITMLKAKYAKRSWSGSVDCPICGGTIAVSITAYNGHTRGSCQTVGCVKWVE